MSDSISACRDAEDEYIALCREFGEQVIYKNGCADFTSDHARELEARAGGKVTFAGLQAQQLQKMKEKSMPTLYDYKGPANSRAIFPHLIGETVKSAFLNTDGTMWLVFASGDALVIGCPDGDTPTYRKEGHKAVKAVVDQRRQEIEGKLAELRDLPGVDLP